MGPLNYYKLTFACFVLLTFSSILTVYSLPTSTKDSPAEEEEGEPGELEVNTSTVKPAVSGLPSKMGKEKGHPHHSSNSVDVESELPVSTQTGNQNQAPLVNFIAPISHPFKSMFLSFGALIP